jgi:hypothetical protein
MYRSIFEAISTSLAQLVKIEQLRLEQDIMTPAIIQQLVAAITALIAQIKTLQSTDTALQDPVLVQSATDAIAAAAAVAPPAPAVS